MPERLTVQLEDGSVARLREMAGGERKVGAFLSMVTAWLYAQREHVELEKLPRYALTTDKTELELAAAYMNKLEERMSEGREAVANIKALLGRLEQTQGKTMRLLAKAYDVDVAGVERILEEAERNEEAADFTLGEADERTDYAARTLAHVEDATDARKRQQPQGRQE